MSDTSQGPGWWQASDGKWYPPEQAPGYQPAPGGAVPAGGYPGGAPTGGTDIGSVFGYAWNKFIQNLGEWVVLWLAILACFIIAAIVSIAVTAGSAFGGFRFNFAGILVGIIFGVLEGLVYVAIAKGAVMVINGQKVDVAAAFKFTTNNIVAGIIFGIAYGFFNQFCFLFGIAVFLFLGFLPVLSALDDKGADGLSESVNLTTSHSNEAMVWWLIGWLIGGLTCGIGAPIAMIGGTYLVKRYRGEPVAP